MATINEKLREAAWGGAEAEVSDLLCKPGCDALSKDSLGRTALTWAALYGHEACVRLLLPVSDARAEDVHGLTALMRAASSGYEGCVRLLLPKSAALAEDKSGWTASCWAREEGHESLARFIAAYALAQGDRSAIDAAVCAKAPRGRAPPRV